MSGCGLREDRQQGLDQKVRPFDIDAERAIEHVFSPLFDRQPDRYTCVEKRNVELSIVSLDGLRQFLLRGHAGRIGAQHQNLGAKFRLRLCDRIRIDADDDDACTFGEELLCRFKANAAGAAGDESTFALQAGHKSSPVR